MCYLDGSQYLATCRTRWGLIAGSMIFRRYIRRRLFLAEDAMRRARAA